MTRANHTIFSAPAFRPISSAKTAARAFDGLLGDEARSARTVGHRWTGVRQETDAYTNALAARCVLV
jgi:hypothetical protein